MNSNIGLGESTMTRNCVASSNLLLQMTGGLQGPSLTNNQQQAEELTLGRILLHSSISGFQCLTHDALCKALHLKVGNNFFSMKVIMLRCISFLLSWQPLLYCASIVSAL